MCFAIEGIDFRIISLDVFRMCEIYYLSRRPVDLCKQFDARYSALDGAAGEVGYSQLKRPGFVIRDAGGQRVVEQMMRGFPRMKDDGCEWFSNAFWLPAGLWKAWLALPEYRCLVPFDKFAEQGSALARNGKNSASWIDVADQDTPCFAGIWKDDLDFGPVYSVLTTRQAGNARPYPRLMPVILRPDQWDLWLHGSLEEVLELQTPYPTAHIRVAA
jgi:putative SOS response-associated peptidase YedK